MTATVESAATHEDHVRQVALASEYEVAAGFRGEPAAFDAQGHAVGRQVFPAEILRQVRAPLVDILVAEGVVRVDDHDRLRWTGAHPDVDRTPLWEALVDTYESLVVATGLGAAAIEATWGRPAVLWEGTLNLYVLAPGGPLRVHRDGWHKMGTAAPEEHFKAWVPLTRLGPGDGGLAVAAGSHRIPDGPGEVAIKHPLHLEQLTSTGSLPSPAVLEPLWRANTFEVGDALAFCPTIVHSTAANTGPWLRMAFAFAGQDARVPLAVKAGLNLDPSRALTDVEHLTLAILAVQPSTPWQARGAFYPRGFLGRLGVDESDDRVARAFETLQARRLIEPADPQPDAAQNTGIHQYFRSTVAGTSLAVDWLSSPGTSTVTQPLFAGRLVLAGWLGLDTAPLLSENPPLPARSLPRP
ncbi:phytanoyl-CoA dioxygenase family protein [Pseudonocardia sp. GCM10023141]|uniref:phytanoyl-CoA dioxygenase family protein n=1 Tax=Pseudonocardia sp. GCM10023141 TaxID=3252653 RepID=UPI00361D9F2B